VGFFSNVFNKKGQRPDNGEDVTETRLLRDTHADGRSRAAPDSIAHRQGNDPATIGPQTTGLTRASNLGTPSRMQTNTVLPVPGHSAAVRRDVSGAVLPERRSGIPPSVPHMPERRAPSVATAASRAAAASQTPSPIPRQADALTFQRPQEAPRRGLTSADLDVLEREMQEQLANQNRAAVEGVSYRKEQTLRTPMRSRADEADLEAIELIHSDTPPEIEEAAVLFASGQFDLCRTILENGLAEPTAPPSLLDTGTNMLLDLYQLINLRQAFDELAAQQAHRSGEPAVLWDEDRVYVDNLQGNHKTAVPTVSLSGKVDALNTRQIDRARKLGNEVTSLRLELGRIASIDPDGCQLLLDTLKILQKPALRLVVVAATELLKKLVPLTENNTAASPQGVWLLTLELHRLLRDEIEYDQTGARYSRIYDVAPPLFTAPLRNVTTLEAESMASGLTRDSHVLHMPAIVEGRTDELVARILNHSAVYNPALIDCTRLIRIEFGAAGQIQGVLANMATHGKHVELRNVNHLVMALLKLLGVDQTSRISARKF